jgi:hypothetical protein
MENLQQMPGYCGFYFLFPAQVRGNLNPVPYTLVLEMISEDLPWSLGNMV